MQPQTWNIHIPNRCGLMKLCQNQSQPGSMAWLNAGFASGQEKLLKTLVRKVLDHNESVTF